MEQEKENEKNGQFGKRVERAKPSIKNQLASAEDKIRSYFEHLGKLSREREAERKKQRQIEKERQSQLKRQIELEKKILAIDTEFPYRADSYKDERPLKERRIQEPEPEKVNTGCWWKSDGYGTLLEDVGGNREEDSGNFPRPWSVRRLYGSR